MSFEENVDGRTDRWLVGCFGFSGPLRQYFNLHQAVSQREGERGEKGQRRLKMSKQPPTALKASAIDPCPTIIKIVGRPGTGSLPRTIAPHDHPRTDRRTDDGQISITMAYLEVSYFVLFFSL